MSDEQKREEEEFPIEGAEVCPSCGCEERIGRQFIRELKAQGKLSEKAFPKETLMLQVPLYDPQHPPLATQFTIPVLQILFDVCKKCKLMYCTGVMLMGMPAQVQMPGPSGLMDILGGRPFPNM